MTRIERILHRLIPGLVALALFFLLLAVGACRPADVQQICGGIKPDSRCVVVLHDSLQAVLGRQVVVVPPPAQDSSVAGDALAICGLELEEAAGQLDELAQVADSLRAELAGRPVGSEQGACPFCTAASLGWMCVLPAGAPYDG